MLLRLEDARREAGGLQEAPEVVPGVRERCTGASAPVAGVDPAEHQTHPRAQRVGHGAHSRRRHHGMIAATTRSGGFWLSSVDPELEQAA